MISNKSDFPKDKMLKKSKRIYSQLIWSKERNAEHISW